MGKTKAKKPTLDQKKLMSKEGLNARDWLVIKDDASGLHLVHRSTGTARVIKK